MQATINIFILYLIIKGCNEVLKTCKSYECKYFYEKIIDRKKKLFVEKSLCNKFVSNGTSPKCYVDKKGEYYNLIAVYDGKKWEHPVRFIENKVGDEEECVVEKE